MSKVAKQAGDAKKEVTRRKRGIPLRYVLLTTALAIGSVAYGWTSYSNIGCDYIQSKSAELTSRCEGLDTGCYVSTAYWMAKKVPDSKDNLFASLAISVGAAIKAHNLSLTDTPMQASAQPSTASDAAEYEALVAKAATEPTGRKKIYQASIDR